MAFTAEEEDHHAFALKVFDGRYWSNVDYANVQVSYELPASCVASTAPWSLKRGASRSDLLYLATLFVPAMIVTACWRRRLGKKQ